jgi:ABC-type transport system involved in multi-copper enzyme maturation permease subunit
MAMFRTILKRELLDHVMSLRFSALFIIMTVLMVTAILDFSVSYQRDVANYPKRVEDFVDAEGNVHLATIPCKAGGIVRQVPSPLAFLANRGERELPNQVVMAIHGVKAIFRSAEVEDVLGDGREVDWTFVVTTILSFGAGLLTYRSLSGELQDGTLSLVFSNSVPRAVVLLGKYVAAVVVLSFCFSVAMVVSLIVLQSLSVTTLTLADWVKVLLFWLVGTIYLSVFVLIGLACSAWARGPLLSAVTFLFLWTGLVFIIPNLGGILARGIGNVMTPAQVHEVAEAIPDRLLREYLQSMVQQVEIGQNLTRISPSAVFTYAGERIAGGGTSRLLQFVENAVRYRKAFFQALLDADRLDPQSEHRYVPWWCGDRNFSLRTVDPGPAKNFRDVPPSLAQDSAGALWDLLLLALANLLAFVVAFVRFLKVDVVPASVL